jgi:hypothetical protein
VSKGAKGVGRDKKVLKNELKKENYSNNPAICEYNIMHCTGRC